MLLLSRKVGEQIVIADDIRVTVLAVSASRVDLGIAAPKEVRILRGELRPHDGPAAAAGHPTPCPEAG
jgi:carbon storage regulator